MPPQIQQRLRPVISGLVDNPRPVGVKALEGRPGALRIRLADYRVIYEVHDDVLLVLVVRVAHRREVYRRI
ncbi:MULTISPECIES: type II toxin-antitoxin system RelE/ParE family toxin [unclassified Frankia]|uniref:type II toxin-antitoxin system RelE family toxin n=1 Tax=unclassified Frankia TaxID=2632575 RepID=UPI0027E0190C|nr:type II toxin-antitoxin system RelE/ParE family toxin [Frankia sp. CiP3]